jgi:hypothetical protein
MAGRAARKGCTLLPLKAVTCNPVARALLLPALAVLAGLACAGADEGRDRPAKSPDGGAGAAEKGPVKMRVVRDEKAVEVEAGTGVDLVVTRPVAIPSRLQYAWPAAPAIEGDAVRFVRARIESPPPDVDGGVTTHHYELEAVKAGSARVTLVPVPASPDAARAPVRLDVTVRAAGAAAGAMAAVTLPALIRDLVETVALSSASPLEIARRLGEVETDSAGGVYVRPGDPRLKKVIAVKRHGTGELNDVELQLAVPGSVTVAELEAMWGSPQHPPPLAIETRTLIFRPPLREGARFRATVTLTLDGDETGPATWVKVIRDAL